MNKFRLNRYSLFYILLAYFLIIISLKPDYYAPVPYNSDVILVLAYSFLGLLFILPLYFLWMVIQDLLKKRFKKLALNMVFIGVLLLIHQVIYRKVLFSYYLEKSQTTVYFEMDLREAFPLFYKGFFL